MQYSQHNAPHHLSPLTPAHYQVSWEWNLNMLLYRTQHRCFSLHSCIYNSGCWQVVIQRFFDFIQTVLHHTNCFSWLLAQVPKCPYVDYSVSFSSPRTGVFFLSIETFVFKGGVGPYSVVLTCSVLKVTPCIAHIICHLIWNLGSKEGWLQAKESNLTPHSLFATQIVWYLCLEAYSVVIRDIGPSFFSDLS